MKLKQFIIGICVLILVLTAILCWPTAGYDLRRVDPGLRDLATPYQSVDAGFYLDGGSIGITIIDRDSHKLELALPVSPEHGGSYPRLYIGATHMSKPGAVEVAFSDDTRRMLISIVEQYGQPSDNRDIVLLELRSAPRDYARAGGRAALRFCRRLVK